MMLNPHLSNDQLIGHAYYTLTDAEREVMDAHLAECQQCRAQLTQHEMQQRYIHHTLLADIKAATLPAHMTFAAIAPRLERRTPLTILWAFFSGATALAAPAGLVIALVGLWQGVGLSGAGTTTTATFLSMLACGCFALTLVGQYEWPALAPSRFTLSALLAFILWLGTAIVGLQNIVVIWNIVAWGLALAGIQFSHAPVLSFVLSIIPTAILWIAVVIGGGEYHFTHLGQPRSWKLFGWTIAGELFILLLRYLV
jgi:hypothetical protein